jgi:hypothetical protein
MPSSRQSLPISEPLRAFVQSIQDSHESVGYPFDSPDVVRCTKNFFGYGLNLMKKEVECQGKQPMVTDSNQQYFVKRTRRRVLSKNPPVKKQLVTPTYLHFDIGHGCDKDWIRDGSMRCLSRKASPLTQCSFRNLAIRGREATPDPAPRRGLGDLAIGRTMQVEGTSVRFGQLPSGRPS